MNRWVLAYAPLIERHGYVPFPKPHCGSIRVDETYVRIRGEWRYLYRAIDKHGEAVDFLLTARRDLEAAKRFFRKILKDGPLLSPDRIGTDKAGTYPGAIATARNEGRLARDTVHHVTKHSSARDRERPFPAKEKHAAGRRLSELQHGSAIHPGVRSHAVATQGVRLCRRLDGPRAEPAARVLLRTFAG